MKINKKVITVILIILFALMVIGKIAQKQAEDNNENEMIDNNKGVQTSEFSLDYDTGIKMTDNLFDYQIKIGNIVYQFPMSLENFMKTGLSFGKYEDPEEKVSSGRMALVWLTYPDGSQINVKVVNFSKSETEIKNCHVVGMELRADYSDYPDILFDFSNISIAKGIVLSKSTFDEVVSAFGEPKKTYEGENSTRYTYEEDIYNTVEFEFDNKTKVLIGIDMQNIETPDDVKEIGVSDKIPELVKNYKKPVALGNDIRSGIFELEGDLYRLPVPLSELISNGWTITKSATPTISGRNYSYVTISKGNIEIDQLYVRNFEEYEVPIEKGIVTRISGTMFTYGKNGSMIFPGNLKVGDSADNFVKNAEKSGFVKNERGDYIYEYDKNSGIGVNVGVEKGKIDAISLGWEKQ